MSDHADADKNNNIVISVEESPENSSSNKIYNHPGGRARSEVWKYFGFFKKEGRQGPATRDNLDMTKAVCKLCKKQYMNKGNTTNLQWHIDHDHNTQATRPTPTQSTLNTTRVRAAAQPSVSSQGKSKTLSVQPLQPKITSVMVDAKISNSRQKLIDGALMKLLVEKVLPLSLVDNPLFKEFVNLLDARYKIPSRSTVNRELTKKHKEIQEIVKGEVQECNDIAITHDGWTSCNTESYSCVTAHFITVNWELVSAVLQTRKVEGSHTSERIADSLTEVKKSWSLPNIIAVSDNAANEKKAFEILNWIRFGCYGHRINLVVKNALTASNEITRVIAKGRKLVTFFHQSSSATDYLLSKQKLLLKEESANHKLIMDVCTRWNSTVNMLRRLLELSPAILALASDSDDVLNKNAVNTIKTYAYTFAEQSLVEKLVEILTPFEIATAIVCADKHPTMHKVLPVIMKIGRSILPSDDDPECIQKMKKKMSDEMIKRCADIDTDQELYLMASILNPIMKDLEFLKQDQRSHAHGLLTEKALELTNLHKRIKVEPADNGSGPRLPIPALPSITGLSVDASEEENEVQEIEIEGPPLKKLKMETTETVVTNKDIIDEWLSDVVCIGATGSTKTDEEIILDEVTRYTKLEISDEDKQLSILHWWKKNQIFFPRLAMLAKKYLCIPSSSVPSKRVFSVAGQVVSKKRARMNSSNVDMLIFPTKNMDRYWK